METFELLLANISEIKDKVDRITWFCCEDHKFNLDHAVNLEDALNKLQNKKYNGLILGNQPTGASYTGIQMLQRIRQLKGYATVSAVILVERSQEVIYEDSADRLSRVLVVPVDELTREKVMEIMHEHFLGMNQ